MTLQFLGEVSDSNIPPLKDAIEDGVKGQGEVLVSLGGIGVFPDWRRPRVIWVGLKRGVKEVTYIYRKLSHRLDLQEDRRFSPHITLGRFNKRYQNIERLKGISYSYDKELGEFQVKEISLIRSTLTQAGPIYNTLSSFSL
mgnify:CR=1 FL=1